jgi:radical SAM superfamily enzyme YgiQ (UPF0313 family)
MEFERPSILRPPSEWRSYYLPVTSGCSNNTCIFCTYHGSRLRLRDVEDVKREIDAVAFYLNEGRVLPGIPDIAYEIASRWDGQGVFLQDGDALVYPFPRMKEALEHLNLKLPSVERVASYATAQDILRRSSAELEELKRLKLGILYLGLESGDDVVLARVVKGVDSSQMIQAAKRVKDAGMLLSVMVILGVGGVERSKEHVIETSRVLSEMDPDYVGALTLSIVPGRPLHDEYQGGAFVPISPFESLKELVGIISESKFTDCFFSSMHASNYFSVRGKLPNGRDAMLATLNRVLERGDPSLLRPEFLRGH